MSAALLSATRAAALLEAVAFALELNHRGALRKVVDDGRDAFLSLTLFLRVLQNQHLGAMSGRSRQRAQAGCLRPQASGADHAAVV